MLQIDCLLAGIQTEHEAWRHWREKIPRASTSSVNN